MQNNADNAGTALDSTSSDHMASSNLTKQDPPPVFKMSDGLSYLHVKRNGLIFGCSTARNISPSFVLEVRIFLLVYSL